MRWLFILGGIAVLLAGALALAWPHRIALPGMLDRWRDPIGETQQVVWDQGPQTADTAPGERSPNVIVILVDDLGINDITTFGGGLAAGDVPRVADDGRVITRAVKLYMDGALGSRGAALLEPYSDRPDTSGLRIAEADETTGMMTQALRDGIQMNVHAIGDRGNRSLLDWVGEALDQVPAEERALAEHRWRDEHSQIVHPDDIPRFAELGVIASMQPSHAIGDLHFAPDRLGDARLEGAYAWQSLLDAGAHLTGGSDAPVEQGDPRIEYYAATARADLSGFQGENWHAEEALSRSDALKLFTLWPAYASFREDELGSIETGKRADFTVFSADIMTIPEADILEVEPVMTVVEGEIVWERAE